LHKGICTKCTIDDEPSSILWHNRLEDISIERIKRLVNKGFLETLDSSNFVTCVDYIKGKQINKTSKGAKKSNEVLKIIHIDIYGPFSAHCLNCHRYFISFIDNHIKYLYLYLLFSKNETLDAFKTYKKEVKRQLEKKINILRSY